MLEVHGTKITESGVKDLSLAPPGVGIVRRFDSDPRGLESSLLDRQAMGRPD
jgi:hypothetical protein